MNKNQKTILGQLNAEESMKTALSETLQALQESLPNVSKAKAILKKALTEIQFIRDQKYITDNIAVKLESLKIGDMFKYNPDDVGVFKVLKKEDPNWIEVIRVQSCRCTGSFPWVKIYPTKEVQNG